MEVEKSFFAEFTQPLSAIKKYKASSDLFTFLLFDGSIIHHTAPDIKTFKKWLDDNKIEKI